MPYFFLKYNHLNHLHKKNAAAGAIKETKFCRLDYIHALNRSPIVIGTTLSDLKTVTGWIICVALCTDLIDGPITRYFKLNSKHGAMLDSIADASIFITSLFSIVWFFSDFVTQHLWQVLLIMGIYLFQIASALVRYGRITTFHKYSAKIAAFPEALFIVTCFFFGPVEWLFYVA